LQSHQSRSRRRLNTRLVSPGVVTHYDDAKGFTAAVREFPIDAMDGVLR
jgi:hypothetical protein